MASISLTDPVAATTVTAGLHAGNNAALRTAINGGLDSTNLAAGAVLNANVNAAAAIVQSKIAFDAWQAFTPVWTATGVAPVIGNAVVTGRYVQIGKLVIYQAKITFGTTSTFGTGSYRFSIPVTLGASAQSNALGIADMVDSSTGNRGLGVAEAVSTTTLSAAFSSTYFGSQTAITNTTPWTWAVSDSVAWMITYEAA